MASSFQTFQLIDSTGYTGCHFIFMDSLQITEEFPSFSLDSPSSARSRWSEERRPRAGVSTGPPLSIERLKHSCHPNPNDICENTSPPEFSVCSGSEVDFLGEEIGSPKHHWTALHLLGLQTMAVAAPAAWNRLQNRSSRMARCKFVTTNFPNEFPNIIGLV